MKLYLSSYHLCKEPLRLSGLSAKNKKVAVIRNALDIYTDPKRLDEGLKRELSDLSAIGLSPEPLDLRLYFGKSKELKRKIGEFGYIWATGGNSFVLRRAFSQSGFDSILQQKLQEDDFVYSGYSAGVCVITPTLKGIHLADEPDAMPAGYPSEVIWTGLGFVPYCIAPHYRSDHFESALIEKAVEYFIEHKLPFIALHDGEALILDTKKPNEPVQLIPMPSALLS
jgi:dipeptidase E